MVERKRKSRQGSDDGSDGKSARVEGSVPSEELKAPSDQALPYTCEVVPAESVAAPPSTCAPPPPTATPTCKHKHRRVYARGLCGPCYQRSLLGHRLDVSEACCCMCSARLHGKFEAGNTRNNGTARMRIKQVMLCFLT